VEQRHDERPDDVELFLDTQRPEVLEALHRRPDPVRRERPQPDLVLAALEEFRRSEAEGRHQDQHEQQVAVVEREDPEDAARKERAVVVSGAEAVEQVAGDEEARQHEEQLHPDPSRARGVGDHPHEARRAEVHVVRHDEENRDAAQAIQGREIRRRSRGAVGVRGHGSDREY
jgi:hypothetical protein